jgi:hypothetical protein
MPSREKATPSAGARSKASGSGRGRAGAAATATTTPTTKAAPSGARGKAPTLRFHSGWREELQGEIVPGGKLRVDYAPDRLPDYRGTLNRKPTWDIVACLLFSPGGQMVSGSVAKKALEVDVPSDATELSIWFLNTDGTGGAAWDSRYGENYRFGVSGGGSGAASGTGARAKSTAAAAAGGATRARGGRAAAGGGTTGASSGGAGSGGASGTRSGGTASRASGTRATGGTNNGPAPRGSASRARGGSQ